MKHQPDVGYSSDDCVQTPSELCEKIVSHFRPQGHVLEPCAGEGNFLRVFKGYGLDFSYCEIKEGMDFYKYQGRSDWIITNPPFSQIRAPRGKDTHPVSFLEKCFQVSSNVALLLTLNHAIGLKSRFKLADKYGFLIREIILVDTPPEPWPQSGFQVACVYWSSRYSISQMGGDKEWRVIDWRKKENNEQREKAV